jgi:hypothetical protein
MALMFDESTYKSISHLLIGGNPKTNRLHDKEDDVYIYVCGFQDAYSKQGCSFLSIFFVFKTSQ